ncbi:MFS transporter [Noviherbaspirillum denitrificans]|uniref:MFS transporter n=1 Tax=Noviherbaspirillum denitrificans TaxID=1968433 RepID=UPI000B52C3CE|nr:MFS transporter [Noviherbaspirillum denitrificans]
MNTENIQHFIENRKLGRFQIQTFVLCGLIVLLDGFDTLAIGYVAPFIMKEWGVTKAALGPVFASGLLGLMIGALIFGPAADRFGRKPVLVASTAMFGVFSLLTIMSSNLSMLILFRFMTGLGLGGAMPNAISLTSEYAPSRIRATVVMTMFCGFSLGGAIGGVLAAHLIREYGWHSVFIVGGTLPLLLVLWLTVSLPESLRYLVVRGKRDGDVRALLARIDSSVRYDMDTRFAVHEENPSGFPVAQLFKNGRAVMTLLLWVMFFMSLFEIFFISNWMPTVFNGLGIPLEKSVLITSLFPVGGTIGTLVLGRFIDTRRPYVIIAAVYVAAAVFVGALGLISQSSLPLLAACSFAAGFCSVGAQVGTNALAAMAYPTMIRSTGVGWALGVGRVGSLVSSLISGVLISLNMNAFQIFLIGAIPIFIAALAAACLSAGERRESSRAVVNPGEEVQA